MKSRPIFAWAHVLAAVKAQTPPLVADALSPISNSCPQDSRLCGRNTPYDRAQWCNYDISTDYEAIIPATGVTREYWLYLNDLYLMPDGYHNRSVITVNNTIPGPTLYADWGDEVVVHAKSNLGSRVLNGSSIHFHGIRQYLANQYDGVGSITKCPIPAQSSMTYRWRATQYGSSGIILILAYRHGTESLGEL